MPFVPRSPIAKRYVRRLRADDFELPADAVRCDRGTKWGNPHSDGTRDQNIARHKVWIHTQPHLMAALHELRGRTLLCWCAPKPCHCDYLSELANGPCGAATPPA